MPKIGCLGVVVLAIVLVVVGGLFLGVPKPGVHLPPGNYFTADAPAHFWDGDFELQIHPHAGEIEPGHEYHFHAEAANEDALHQSSEHPYYQWVFWIDEKEVGREAGHSVEYEFEHDGNYTVQVYLYSSEDAFGNGEDTIARAMSNEPASSAFPITNTMVASWMTVIVLISLAYFAMRKRQLVPTGLQNAFEWVVEWFLNFVESAAGRENGRRFFPVVATIFFFVIVNSYMALVPIFNVIGWGSYATYETAFFGEQTGFLVNTTLFRSANTDVNLPLALAIVSFISVEFWGISSLGIGKYMAKFIKIGPLVHGFKGLFKGKVMDMLIAVIEAFVGFIELILEFMRMVSFTFRLFGNMTAGEVLLMMMAFLIPLLVAIPFYGLELLVGFIQGLVFAGLTLGFAMIAVAPHEEEHD
ncbi:MAG: F0F1 ATP synthase subunit A [Chloroflexota bacterium]|nr:F0F1 ATP synthase subunit A [Chloroflexota bacterium]